jgi:hypothetical protein
VERLTEAIIGLCDLAEAEGRLIQQKIIQTLVVILMYVAAALLLMVAVGFILAALYEALAVYLQTPWVFMIMGSICLLLAGITIWSAKLIIRRQ